VQREYNPILLLSFKCTQIDYPQSTGFALLSVEFGKKGTSLSQAYKIIFVIFRFFKYNFGMLVGKTTIREVTKDQLIKSAQIIRDSFKPVAIEFSLTKDNCATHASFIKVRQLYKLWDRGIKLFGIFLSDRQIGFVAIEKADENLYYMEKLAILPEYQHNNYGAELVRFVFDYIRNRGGHKVSVRIIDEHTVLKSWYKELGFKEMGTQVLSHLPFRVCFMEKCLVK